MLGGRDAGLSLAVGRRCPAEAYLAVRERESAVRLRMVRNCGMPAKCRGLTEHKKHYRTLYRRDFDLGFHGVASLCTIFAFPKSRLNACRLMSMSLSLAVINSRWIDRSLKRFELQSLDD